MFTFIELQGFSKRRQLLLPDKSVSYTHLTLPTTERV